MDYQATFGKVALMDGERLHNFSGVGSVGEEKRIYFIGKQLNTLQMFGPQFLETIINICLLRHPYQVEKGFSIYSILGAVVQFLNHFT